MHACKRQLTAFAMLVALIVFGVLNLGTVRLSAYTSPAIYIIPSYVQEDPWSAIGTKYTFSVWTDYDDNSDVWGYEFKLTYNPLVLEGFEVVNGDLITDETWFDSVGFNDTTGELGLTGNGFDYESLPPPMTSGPGILANVTFTVVSYGISNIALVESETRLIGYDPEHPRANQEGFYNIIDEYWPHTGHIEGSFFYNTIPSDANGDGYVNVIDLGLLSDAWLAELGEIDYNPNCDFNWDTYCNVVDLGTMSDHWLQSFP